MTAQAENLVRLLGGVSAELKAVRTARERYAVKLSPDFNCFDYIEPDELRLSQILAELLNPKGSHAQASRFLDAFLRQIGLGDWEPKAVESVKREDPTHNGRRVDIRIRWTDGCELVIENKPWANDSKDQLRDYIQDLEKRKVVDWRVVYLGGRSAEPDPMSLQTADRDNWVKENKLTLVTYGGLIVPWLTECMGVCESDRFRWFLGEFKAYVLAEFRGESDMAVTHAVVKTVLANPANVEAAFEVQVAIDEILEKLLDKLKNQLQQSVANKKWEIEGWKYHNSMKYFQFDVTFSPDSQKKQKCLLRFEFNQTQFKDFYVGMRKLTGAPDGPQILEIIKKADLGLDIQPDSNWEWFAYFKDDLRNWKLSSVPWKQISDGTLALYLFELIEKVYNAFERENKLGLLG